MGKGAQRSGTEIGKGNCNSNESIIWLPADTEAGTQQNAPFDSEHGAGWRHSNGSLNKHHGIPVPNWSNRIGKWPSVVYCVQILLVRLKRRHKENTT